MLLTLLLNALLLGVLFMNASDSNRWNPVSKESDKELAIQFQLLEELEMPTSGKKNTTTEPVKQTATAVESSEDKQSTEESEAFAGKDSVLLTEMKKTLDEIQLVIPEDTVLKEQVKIENSKKVLQNVAKENNNLNERRKFYYDNYRMISNIQFLYPYVLKVRQVVNDLNAKLATMKNNDEKHRLIRKTEKELFAQFEKDVRKMSYSQGKLLLKLIARETNESAYGLIKTYKGGIPATFWYTVGLVFQEDLKTKYDSIGEDAKIEMVVRKYKQGDF